MCAVVIRIICIPLDLCSRRGSESHEPKVVLAWSSVSNLIELSAFENVPAILSEK